MTAQDKEEQVPHNGAASSGTIDEYHGLCRSGLWGVIFILLAIAAMVGLHNFGIV